MLLLLHWSFMSLSCMPSSECCWIRSIRKRIRHWDTTIGERSKKVIATPNMPSCIWFIRSQPIWGLWQGQLLYVLVVAWLLWCGRNIGSVRTTRRNKKNAATVPQVLGLVRRPTVQSFGGLWKLDSSSLSSPINISVWVRLIYKKIKSNCHHDMFWQRAWRWCLFRKLRHAIDDIPYARYVMVGQFYKAYEQDIRMIMWEGKAS